MEFGIGNCAHVTVKAGKLVSAGEMELSSGEVITTKVRQRLQILRVFWKLIT